MSGNVLSMLVKRDYMSRLDIITGVLINEYKVRNVNRCCAIYNYAIILQGPRSAADAYQRAVSPTCNQDSDQCIHNSTLMAPGSRIVFSNMQQVSISNRCILHSGPLPIDGCIVFVVVVRILRDCSVTADSM